MLDNNNINLPNINNLNNKKFTSNFQYRNYLTTNGKNIININKDNYIFNQQYNCNHTITSTPISNNNPYIYNCITDNKQPHGYTESDLKSYYINKILQKYAQDDYRIMNAIEYIYNIPYNQSKYNVQN
tara:strand:- start:4583 stop:4966 length:384 start_codon:yes stop_codon:yes gene_type:complete